MDISEQKKAIRKQILNKRKLMSKSEVLSASLTICNKIINLDIYISCNNICIYSPINNEVDVFLLIDNALNQHKKIFLPKTIDEDILFFEYDGKQALIPGKYNILEPSSDKQLSPDNKTLIIMPGAVFSYSNDRIGYGGGYYDRFLSMYPLCNTLAVAYDFQLLPSIPCEKHDIRPQLIVTEHNCI